MPIAKVDSKVQDSDTKAIIFEGASISQLGRLFGMDNRTVQSKIVGLEPCGRRAGAAIYSVKDAAPFLVETQLNIDDIEQVITYVRKLNHTNLPKMLTKEFWHAMLAKQKFEVQAGDLWPTDKVAEVYGDLVKAVRVPLILAKDSILNEVELSGRQHQILDAIIDGLLGDLQDAVAKQFGARAAQDLGDDDL